MPTHSTSSLPSKTPSISRIMPPPSFRLSHATKQSVSILQTTPPSTSYADLPTPPPTPPLQPKSNFISSATAIQTSSSSISPPNLQTIPPELLLSIISHLEPASYSALTQTSQTLKSFFKTHASIICTQRILTHHSAEASILRASFSAVDSLGTSWLVPTHEAIYRAEESWWDIEGSVSSLRTRGTNEEALKLQRSLHLSQPGPQFLLFLERRGWEIRTRYLMMQDQTAFLSSSSAFESSSPGEREREKMQIEQYLSWTLERGSIRGFLEELGTFAEHFVDPKPQIVVGPVEDVGRVNIKERLRLKATAFKARFGKKEREQEPEKTALLFGEVGRNEEKYFPNLSAQTMKKDKFVEGLLWYHGRTGVSGYSTPSERILGERRAEIVKEKQNFRSCMKRIKEKASRSRQRLGKVFKGGWKCGSGSFESLD